MNGNIEIRSPMAKETAQIRKLVLQKVELYRLGAGG